jgi:hypothetical protein
MKRISEKTTRSIQGTTVFSVTKALILWLMLISGIVAATYQIRSQASPRVYSVSSS